MIANSQFIIIASIEDIFPIIFIIAVFLNFILKSAGKKMAEKQNDESGNDAEEPGQQRPAFTSAQRELQDFLQTLTGQKPKAPPAATPVLVPPSSPSAARITSRPKRRQAKRTQPPPTPAQDPHIKQAPIAPTPSPAVKKRPSSNIDELRIKMGMDLIDKSSLKKAILLREVLGPPLALRRDQ